MNPIRPLLAALALAVTGAACSDDADSTAEASATTTTTEATTTSTEDAPTTTAASTELTGEEAAAAEVVATLFDSSAAFDAKVALVEGGEAHRADHDAYVQAATAVGGIALAPTAVTIAGDQATVTYDVLFAGTAVYEDLTVTADRSGDGWVISTEEFCGFLASARVTCSA
jgi:hypothetical protein